MLTPGETRRRSARLNSKGRSSGDGIDVEVEPDQPVVKRSKPRSRENGKNKTEGEYYSTKLKNLGVCTKVAHLFIELGR